MREPYQTIYCCLVAAIAQNNTLDLPETSLLKMNFLQSLDFWEKVKRDTTEFPTEKEEIDFFRNIKPAFTGHLHYYETITWALLAAPRNPALIWAFWNNELGRRHRFCQANKDFVQYYESGGPGRDTQYFLTRSYAPGDNHSSILYDTDKKFCTQGDLLVSSLRALGLYEAYVARKLQGMARQLLNPPE